MPAFLVPVSPGQVLIPLEKPIILIGRQADCDVSLTTSRKISRHHCCVAQVNNYYLVRDLNSTNGVFLNGNRVKKEVRIEMGDELVIGDIHYRLQDDVAASARGGTAKSEKPAAKGAIQVAPNSPPPPPPVRRTGVFPSGPQSLGPDDDEESTPNPAKPPNIESNWRQQRSRR